MRYVVALLAIAMLAATSDANAHRLHKGKRGSEVYWRHNYYHAFYTLRWWDAIFGRRYFVTIREVVLERRETSKHRRLLRLSTKRLAWFDERARAREVDGCLRDLIFRESGAWPPYTTRHAQVTNRSSGAYGLGQALPASKMRPWGLDYLTNPFTQIRWMKSYVRKYGGSCGALAFQQSNGFY